jgi:hypothetical protein
MRLGRRAVPGADLILLQSGAGRSRPRTALVPRNSEGLDPPEGRRTLAAGCCHASWAGRCWNESRSSRRRSPAGPRNSAVARPLRARQPAFAGLPCGCCGLPSSEGASRAKSVEAAIWAAIWAAAGGGGAHQRDRPHQHTGAEPGRRRYFGGGARLKTLRPDRCTGRSRACRTRREIVFSSTC